MIVCVCHRVSDRDIARHVHDGMDFSDLQLELGVATQCGNCEGCARELVARCASACRPSAMAALQASPLPQERAAWFFSPASA